MTGMQPDRKCMDSCSVIKVFHAVQCLTSCPLWMSHKVKMKADSHFAQAPEFHYQANKLAMSLLQWWKDFVSMLCFQKKKKLFLEKKTTLK